MLRSAGREPWPTPACRTAARRSSGSSESGAVGRGRAARRFAAAPPPAHQRSAHRGLHVHFRSTPGLPGRRAFVIRRRHDRVDALQIPEESARVLLCGGVRARQDRNVPVAVRVRSPARGSRTALPPRPPGRSRQPRPPYGEDVRRSSVSCPRAWTQPPLPGASSLPSMVSSSRAHTSPGVIGSARTVAPHPLRQTRKNGRPDSTPVAVHGIAFGPCPILRVPSSSFRVGGNSER